MSAPAAPCRSPAAATPPPGCVVENAAGTLCWREEGFWHWTPAAGHETTAEEAGAYIDALIRHRGGRPAPLLIDRRHPYSPSFGAWQRFRAVGPQYISAIAYYAPTAMSAAASAYVRQEFLQPWDKVEIFRTLDEAEGWLRAEVEP